MPFKQMNKIFFIKNYWKLKLDFSLQKTYLGYLFIPLLNSSKNFKNKLDFSENTINYTLQSPVKSHVQKHLVKEKSNCDTESSFI